MPRLKTWLFILGGLALLLGVLYVIVGLFWTDFLVDMWWFRSLGLEGYFWQKLTYRYVVFASFTCLFFLVFFLNFWVASRYLGMTLPSQAKGEEVARKRYRDLAYRFRTGSMRVYAPFSLILGLLVAYPLFQEWEAALLYLFAPAAGLTDPMFGIDVSYYLSSLPIYLLLWRELAIAFGLLFLGLALLYWLERRVLMKEEQRLHRGAKLHLAFIILALAALGAWGFLLERHNLVYTQVHQNLFYGPGFVQMWVIIPLLWFCLGLAAATGLALARYVYNRQGLKPLILLAVLLALALGGRYAAFLPDMVQKYLVSPYEITREKPAMERNIRATLEAYDLTRVETREYQVAEGPWQVKEPQVRAVLRRNIPVWDKEVLLEVYEQLQELRTYYDFTQVDVDRYTVNGVYQQVFLAPRELNLRELPPGTQNWVNERLKYTHGYGVVMTPAAQGGEEPMTWFIEGIPPRSDYGFKIEQPAIYFGLADYAPVIVPNDSRELGHPTEEGHTLTDYAGKDGVRINSFFRKLIFSMYFKEKDIFFTTKTNAHSRMLFRRNIVQRITHITPFFQLDGDPYMVVTPQGLYWVQDAYTASSRYPCATPYEGRFNYLSKSVKIVVDAYNGTVSYYLADGRDPMVQAYRRIYPGLLRDLAELPAELKPHLRYPKDLFEVQMAMYARYHQTDPEIYYKQEDLWDFPDIQRNAKTIKMKPYYLTLNLLDQEKFEFIQLAPMTPKARANLRALCVVGCDPPNYGKIVVYTFPKGALVEGPSQVDALIDQDTTISEQFTLWNMMGSQVERGRMLMLPVGGAIVYLQPVYLKAAGKLKIPQLKRLILCKGEMVVMQPSLEEGFLKLNERIQRRLDRMKGRMEPMAPPPDATPSPVPAAPPPAPPAPSSMPAAPAPLGPEAMPPPGPKVEPAPAAPPSPPAAPAAPAPKM